MDQPPQLGIIGNSHEGESARRDPQQAAMFKLHFPEQRAPANEIPQGGYYSTGDSDKLEAFFSRLCGRAVPAAPAGGGVRGWGRDGLGTGARGRGARARRALMCCLRSAASRSAIRSSRQSVATT